MLNYKLKRSSEDIKGMRLELETLEDLDQTIDLIFEKIDTPEDASLLEDLCPYFGVVWPAARALAEHVASLGTSCFAGARVLEVGCGLALPSLVAVKLGATVVATDFHPEVPRFLNRNLALNQITSGGLEYRALNWRETWTHGSALGAFDWVVGSDILYEKEHPRGVAGALVGLAGKKGRIIVADPGRPYLQPFVDEMTRLGFRHDTLVKTVLDHRTGTGKDVFLLLFNRASVLG